MPFLLFWETLAEIWTYLATLLGLYSFSIWPALPFVYKLPSDIIVFNDQSQILPFCMHTEFLLKSAENAAKSMATSCVHLRRALFMVLAERRWTWMWNHQEKVRTVDLLKTLSLSGMHLMAVSSIPWFINQKLNNHSNKLGKTEACKEFSYIYSNDAEAFLVGFFELVVLLRGSFEKMTN